jgi:excisionase family DNA binding protein
LAVGFVPRVAEKIFPNGDRRRGVLRNRGGERKEVEPMNTPPRDSRRHYESVANAAARVGVSTKTVRRWIASSQLAGYRMGARLLRVDPDDVDQMLTPIPTVASPASARRARRAVS